MAIFKISHSWQIYSLYMEAQLMVFKLKKKGLFSFSMCRVWWLRSRMLEPGYHSDHSVQTR